MTTAALDSLQQLAASGDMAALASFCEEFELDLGHAQLAPAISSSVWTIHMAAYLLTRQLDAARLLWKRLASDLRDGNAELRALWEVCTTMWRNEHAATQAAISAFSWPGPLLADLMARLQTDELQRTMELCVGAYSLISAAALAARLGVSEERAHELATGAGWTVDAESGGYVPLVPERPKTKPEMLEQLELLTSYVAHVDKELK